MKIWKILESFSGFAPAPARITASGLGERGSKHASSEGANYDSNQIIPAPNQGPGAFNGFK